VYSAAVTETGRRRAGGRPPLTAEAVVDAALALADADGLDALTMRRLATTLGVTPMALYWHHRDKDELLDAMAARVFDFVDTSRDRSTTWQQQLRQLLDSLLDALRAHPSAAALVSTRTVSTPAALDATEALLAILRRGGFSPSDATTIARHAVATVANLVAAPSGVVRRGSAVPDPVASVPADRYPRLVEAADSLRRGVPPDEYVATGLELLLAGIEGLADAP
jgi:AcrR family transcriptional regulator